MPSDVALFVLGSAGDVELYMKDNIAVDRMGRPVRTNEDAHQ